MAQVDTLDILFDRDSAVYRESDLVSGHVLVVNSHDVAYKQVRIELRGVAIVCWDPDDDVARVDPDHASAGGDVSKEVCFCKRITLLEKGGVLPPGDHVFAFECKLPPELPSSFTGRYGEVSYVARATVAATAGVDASTRRSFTLHSGLDLNFIPEAAARIELCKYKQVGRCCVPSGTVTVEWLVERSGYVPGESIVVHGELQNDCKAPVVYCKTALNMIIVYKVRKRRQTEKREIVVIRQEETPPGEVLVWHETLQVPPLPPTGLGRCRLIDISYQLQFSALVEGASSVIAYTKDVYIGTEPMCAREMRSCIAGMFNQPYTASRDDLGQLAHLCASQVSLAQVVATAGAIAVTANPSAPPAIPPAAVDPCVHAVRWTHGGTEQRPPPYAPDHTSPGVSPWATPRLSLRPSPAPSPALSPSAPAANTLGRNTADEVKEDSDSAGQDL